MKKHSRPLLSLVFIYFFYSLPAFANVGAIAGSNIFSISGASGGSTNWKIVSASTVGDAVFSGVVDSVVEAGSVAILVYTGVVSATATAATSVSTTTATTTAATAASTAPSTSALSFELSEHIFVASDPVTGYLENIEVDCLNYCHCNGACNA